MSHAVLIRGARQLLTLNGPSGPFRGKHLSTLTVIEDGSVLITQGKINVVGPTRRIENVAEAKHAIEIDATGRVVMPAFVDAHHDLMRDCTGRGSGRALDAQANRIVRLCVRHGTGTLEARSGCGFDAAADLRMFARRLPYRR